MNASPQRRVRPPGRSIDAVVRPPGSKSETNRALVCAALAPGISTIDNVLFADDTEAMIGCLRGLGVQVQLDETATSSAVDSGRVVVRGVGGRPMPTADVLDARLSGTTARFAAPLAALAHRPVRIVGAPGLEARPMDDLIGALRQLGASVDEVGAPGHLPIVVGSTPMVGGEVTIRGDVSSQFLSGLLLSAPCAPLGLTVRVSTTLVSEPYVALTTDVMRRFGASVEGDAATGFRVGATGYSAADVVVEADASAASYLLAAPLFTGGRIRVLGVGSATTQGDAVFADILAEMGADVRQGADWTEVTSVGPLRAVDVDLRDASDVAQTLAVVASLAEGRTSVRGIGFIRAKETDRITAVVQELNRLGIRAEEEADGFSVEGGEAHGGLVRTYGDHRMAMSFALLGLRIDGLTVEDPACVEKTFPGYFEVLDRLAEPPVEPRRP